MEHPHLDPEALLRAAYDVATATEAKHLATCDVCAAAGAALNSQRVSSTRASAASELPEAFWQRQRQAIVARIEQPAAAGYRRLAMAVSLVVLLAAMVLSRGGRSPRAPLHTAEDEQLLRDIHLIVNHIEPRALAPATLLLPDQTIQEVQRP